jgi:hypothetical protein
MTTGHQGYLTPEEFRSEVAAWLRGTNLAIAQWDQLAPTTVRWVAAEEIPDGGPLLDHRVLPKTDNVLDSVVRGRNGAGIILWPPQIVGRVLVEAYAGIKAENEAQLELVPTFRVIQRRLRKRAYIPTLTKFPGIEELRPRGSKCSDGALEWFRNGGELRTSPKTDPYSVPAPLAPGNS